MIKVGYLTLLFLSLFPNLAHSKLNTDYQIDSVFRSFPVGGYFNANAGVSKEIWGNQEEKPLYGFVRAGGNLRTSGIINGAMAELQFFPISFLGAFAGYEKVYRNPFALDTFDCSLVHCQGNAVRKSYGLKGALAVKGYFTLFNLSTNLQEMEKSASDRRFADEVGTLEGSQGKDRRNTLSLIVGKNLNDSTKAGLVFLKHKMKGTSQDTLFRLLILQKTIKTIDWTLGLGTFQTRYDQNVISGIVQLKYFPSKGLQLF
jgi:hypothetical protein